MFTRKSFDCIRKHFKDSWIEDFSLNGRLPTYFGQKLDVFEFGKGFPFCKTINFIRKNQTFHSFEFYCNIWILYLLLRNSHPFLCKIRYLHYGEDPLFKFQPPLGFQIIMRHRSKTLREKFLSFTNIYFADLGHHFGKLVFNDVFWYSWSLFWQWWQWWPGLISSMCWW